MKFSVVTPVCNGELFLNRTLESVAQQQGPLEHIVQDACSTDRTAEICKDFGKTHSVRHIVEKDYGMYDAIARGFEKSDGEICCWINSDDYFLPNAFQKVRQFFVQNPQVSWITGFPASHPAASQDFELGPVLPQYPTALIRAGFYHPSLLGCIRQESVFWRRTLWDKCEAPALLRRYRYAGDFALWRRFAQHTSIVSIPHALAVFAFRDGQISISNAKEYRAECGVAFMPTMQIPGARLAHRLLSTALLPFRKELMRAKRNKRVGSFD